MEVTVSVNIDESTTIVLQYIIFTNGARTKLEGFTDGSVKAIRHASPSAPPISFFLADALASAACACIAVAACCERTNGMAEFAISAALIAVR